MAVPPRVQPSDLGGWLLKSRLPPAAIDGEWAPGVARRLTRCLRRSYRTALMEPGQPCLLWVSGAVEPGVHAVGLLTGEPRERVTVDPGSAEVEVDVRLWRLPEPVSRTALRADPAWATAEVLRMPAGSNPSYVTRDAWSVLADLVDPEVRGAAGGPWVR